MIGTSLFSKKFFFCYSFQTSTKTHQPSGMFFRQVCRKCSLRVHGNILRRSLSLGNLFGTNFFHIFIENFPTNCQFFFDCVVKTAFYLFRWTFRVREKWKLYNFFPDFELFFSRCFSKICNGVAKTEFCIRRGTFCVKTVVLWKNYNFLSLSHIVGKKTGFCQKSSGLNVKTAFYVALA